MAYLITYLVNSQPTGSEAWNDTLSAAMDHAERTVASGTADRVEIRDDAEKLIFHHPRATWRA